MHNGGVGGRVAVRALKPTAVRKTRSAHQLPCMFAPVKRGPGGTPQTQKRQSCAVRGGLWGHRPAAGGVVGCWPQCLPVWPGAPPRPCPTRGTPDRCPRRTRLSPARPANPRIPGTGHLVWIPLNFPRVTLQSETLLNAPSCLLFSV